MVLNMAAVHAIIIANAHRRHEEEYKRECQRREQKEKERAERMICRKTISCRACMDYLPETCPKKKINQK